jgi:hypothetical protein
MAIIEYVEEVCSGELASRLAKSRAALTKASASSISKGGSDGRRRPPRHSRANPCLRRSPSVRSCDFHCLGDVMNFIRELIKWYYVYRAFSSPLKSLQRAFFMARTK